MSGLTKRLARRPVRLLAACGSSSRATSSQPQWNQSQAHEGCSHRRLRPFAVAAGVMIAALATAQDAAQCDAAADRAKKKTQRADYFDDLYETTSLLGCGMSGVVMQCVAKRDGHRAAVKVVQDLGDDETDECAREQAALSLVEQRGGHMNIVGYHGSYRQDGVHYLVTEYLPGRSLFEFIQQHHHVDVRTALQLTAQLASALAFLKQCDLVHRDVKPENIVLLEPSTADEQLRLKLIDFGSAGHVAKQATSETMLSGTHCYWPPEVLARGETSSAMDMWALGCVLYILIAGRHPFDVMGSSTEQQIVQRIQTDTVSFLCPIWCDVAPEIKQLIRGLLEKDPKRRLLAEDVLALIPAL